MESRELRGEHGASARARVRTRARAAAARQCVQARRLLVGAADEQLQPPPPQLPGAALRATLCRHPARSCSGPPTREAAVSVARQHSDGERARRRRLRERARAGARRRASPPLCTPALVRDARRRRLWRWTVEGRRPFDAAPAGGGESSVGSSGGRRRGVSCRGWAGARARARGAGRLGVDRERGDLDLSGGRSRAASHRSPAALVERARAIRPRQTRSREGRGGGLGSRS